MLFTSLGYLLLFLPLVVIGARLANAYGGPRYAQVWILGASLVFYASARPIHVWILAASVVFNWWVARRAGASGRSRADRRPWLVVGLAANVALLATFKYTNALLAGFGSLAALHVRLPDWDFPLGISFYTLMQVMYLVDCYQGLLPPLDLLDHGTFVTFFPHVTAGPIDRAKSFMEQLPRIGETEGRGERAARALALIAIGAAKKAVIADSFAHLADAGFAAPGALSTLEAWITSLSYTFQIYFDFSGYTDIAVGSALLLGIAIMRNFRAPYRATSISDFWQRWHMSLTSFITTYLYTPILRGMGRITVHRAAVAILVAMTIVGAWHGPALTFVLFGFMHGVALAINQYWRRAKRRMPRPLAWVVTFAFVNLAFIVFRSPSVASAATLARALIHGNGGTSLATLLAAIMGTGASLLLPAMAVGVVVAFVGPTSDEIADGLALTRRSAVAVATVLVVALLFINSTVGKDFVYFAF